MGGKIGEAAKAVADILHAHFKKEEEYALPPLGLLSSLVSEEHEQMGRGRGRQYKLIILHAKPIGIKELVQIVNTMIDTGNKPN